MRACGSPSWQDSDLGGSFALTSVHKFAACSPGLPSDTLSECLCLFSCIMQEGRHAQVCLAP